MNKLEPVELTMLAVLVAGRISINEGILQAQNLDQETTLCWNKSVINGKTCYCIIGSALPEEIRSNRMLVDKSIQHLVYNGFVKMNEKEFKDARKLQRLHDSVISHSVSRKITIEEFIQEFEQMEVKYGTANSTRTA